MKKRISLILAVALLFATVTAFPIHAEAAVRISAGEVVARKGAEVDVDLVIDSNDGFGGLSLYFVMPEGFELISITNAIDDLVLTYDANAVWDGAVDYTGVGVLAKLKIRVPEDAVQGQEYVVGVEKVEAFDYGMNEVDVYTTNGSITIGDGCTPASEFTFDTDAVNGTAVITEFVGASAEVDIAPTYNIEGTVYNVIGIGEEAFGGNEAITSVVIPDSVTDIADYAFYECTSLISYTIKGNPTIGEVAVGYFDSDSKISRVVLAIVEGATIHAWSGDETVTSKAQEYATDNGIVFDGLEDFDYAGCQVSNDIKTAENFDIRFAGIIDALHYQKVGFKVSEETFEKSWVSESATVYKSLSGKTPDRKTVTAVTAAECGGEYIFALAITDVPTDTAINFTVTPYVVNQLGAKVYGGASIVNVTAGGEVS